MASQCLVLHPNNDRENLLQSVNAAVKSINKELGSFFARAGAEEGEQSIHYFWANYAEEGWRIQLTEDFLFPAQYIHIIVPNQGSLSRICNVFQTELDFFCCEELIEEARLNLESDPGSIARVALGCKGPFNHEIKALIERAFSSQNSAVRDFALTASYLFSWVELLPTLEEALEAETDERIVRGLTYAIQMFQNSRSE